MRHLARLFLITAVFAMAGCGGGDPSPMAPSSTKIKSQGGTTAPAVSDELILPYDRLQYQIDSTAAGYTIAAIPADGASHSFAKLRRIQFADVSLALDTEASGRIYRLYQAAFDRAPDLPGLGYWLEAYDAAMTLEQIAEGFISSAEFKQLYGAAPTDQEFLSKLYNNILHRAPDNAGLAYWTSAMKNGPSKAAVLVAFSDSSENQAQVEPAIQGGIAYAKKGIAYRPVARVGNDVQAVAGTTITLDGSSSSDANGDALHYAWSLDSKPAGSKAVLTSAATARPSLVADLAGDYQITLTVGDGVLNGRALTVKVTASPPVVQTVADTGVYKCIWLDAATAAQLYAAGHTYLDRDHDGKPCEVGDTRIEMLTVPVIADTGLYKCSQLTAATARQLYAAGHTYLDRDNDGKPCEANDIKIEVPAVVVVSTTPTTPVTTTPTTPTTPTTTGAKKCWVNGYTRKNGTHVSGYWRSC